MPIFEYMCAACNRIYSFLSLAAKPSREPVCPRCGATDLRKVPSAFAVRAPRKTAVANEGGGGDEGPSEQLSGVETEAMRMLEGLDESEAEDPRVMAKVMRRLAESAGEPVTPTMEEMLRRMEAGEDPETLEEELGDQLEAEMDDGGGGPTGSPARDDGLYSL